MATRDIVPRADGEGQIGTTEKRWLGGHFKTLYTNRIENDGSGDTPDYVLSSYASWADAISSISTTVVRLIVDTDATVSLDSTAPSTLMVKVLLGSTITVATTKTLTINGAFEAGMYQVFNCEGTGAVVFGAGSVKEACPEWWYSGSGSYHTAINASLNTGKPVKFSQLYSITDSISLPASGAIITGNGRTTSGLTGSLNGQSYLRSSYGESPTAGQRSSNWILKDFSVIATSPIEAGSIGINMNNVGYSDIDCSFINLNQGVIANQTAIYNKFRYPRIVANTGMYLESDSGGNSIYSPFIAANVKGIDFYSGMYDLFGGSIEVASGGTHAIHIGRTPDPGGGIVSEVGVYNTYVEASDGIVVPVEIGANAQYVTIDNLRIHGVMGALVNGGDSAQVTINAFAHNSPQARINKIIFGSTLSNANASLKAPSGSLLDVRLGDDSDYAYIRSKGIWISGAGGITATNLAAYNLRGVAVFSSATTDAVVFDTNETDANYFVVVTGNANRTYWVSDKAVTGFTINASASCSDSVDWILIR